MEDRRRSHHDWDDDDDDDEGRKRRRCGAPVQPCEDFKVTHGDEMWSDRCLLRCVERVMEHIE